MHKSAITLSLFLLVALIMLVPFTSINFSNVKAQEYGIYDDDDRYSKYPTEVNKYECRTGPFEGFFVGSVEFCKHVKFDKDDRKDNNRDNRTGTQGSPGPPGASILGPAGPQGIQGVTGPQGPSGITQLNATNLYSVNNSTSSDPIDPVESVAAFALCDIGDFAISGGYNINRDLATNDTVETVLDQSIQSIQPITGPPLLGGREGWSVVTEAHDPSSELTLNMNALCFDNPPLR